MSQLAPFANKELINGKKLFRRKHGYTFTLAASGDTVKSITVPYAIAKVNEAEVMWAPEGVTVNMKVKDTAAGNYTGVPNHVLSQYGYSVAVSKDHYVDESQYDATVYIGMILEFTFTNSSVTEKTIAVNITFHEVV